jgi:hypothetical protein
MVRAIRFEIRPAPLEAVGSARRMVRIAERLLDGRR